MAKTVKVTMNWQNRPVEESTDVDFLNVKIVQGQRPGKVELYLLDDDGDVVEGGEFDQQAFIDHILKFYNKNF